MRLRLIPREERFFADFVVLSERIVSAAKLLDRMLASNPPAWDMALQIREIEHECDAVAHQIIQRLNRTFVTPFDREDIHALATSLDDVMDALDAAATVVRRFRISQVRYGARELASLCVESATLMQAAVEALEKRDGVHDRAVEVNRVENAADEMHDESLRRLFEEEENAITVIKWKEVLDLLEDATDRCEDVADVLQGVVVKHG